MVLHSGTAVMLDSMKRTYHKFFAENVDEFFQIPESSIDRVSSLWVLKLRGALSVNMLMPVTFELKKALTSEK